MMKFFRSELETRLSFAKLIFIKIVSEKMGIFSKIFFLRESTSWNSQRDLMSHFPKFATDSATRRWSSLVSASKPMDSKRRAESWKKNRRALVGSIPISLDWRRECRKISSISQSTITLSDFFSISLSQTLPPNYSCIAHFQEWDKSWFFTSLTDIEAMFSL